MGFKVLRRKTSVGDCKTHVKSSRLFKTSTKASRLKTLQVLKTRAKISRLKTSVGDCSRARQDLVPQDAPRAPQDVRQDLAPQNLSGRLLRTLRTRAKTSRLKPPQDVAWDFLLV
jgi:hypothetical protein